MKFLYLLMFLCGYANAGNIYGFGDSITVGVNAPYSHLNVVSAYFDSVKINKAVSGSMIANQSLIAYDTDFSQSDKTLFLTGYNDMRYHGANSNVYKESLEATLAWLGSGNKQKAINLITTGNWANTPVNKIGKYTSDANASIIATVNSSIIYIGSIHQTTTSGSFSVEIDGIHYGNYQTQGGANHNGINYNPFLIRIQIESGLHIVTIKRLSGQIFIDWIGGNQKWQSVYVSGCLKMPSESYALGAPFNKGSAIIADNYTQIIQDAVAVLQTDGLDINYVNNTYSPAMIHSDKVHPNETGQLNIAIPFIKAIGIN